MAYIYQYTANAGLTHIFMDTDFGCLVAMNSADVMAMRQRASDDQAAVDSLPAEMMSEMVAASEANSKAQK